MTDASILIVDDNMINLQILIESLSFSGFRPLIASSGAQALQRVGHTAPDLILLDVIMPGLDGFETCRRLKRNPDTREIPVIFMTALSDMMDKIRGFDAGGVDYITKPFQTEEVLARVRTQLHVRRLQQNLTENNSRLQQEIAERKQAEKELNTYRDHLESLVTERTLELKHTNEELHQEILERQHVEKELRKSEERYRELFNHLNSGVAVYEAVNDGQDFIFTDFNQAGERIDNTRKDQLIGQSVVDMFPGVKDCGLFGVFQQVWRTGETIHHPVSLYQDGRLNGWRENEVYKLPSGEIVAVYTDETERKQSEELMRKLVTAVETMQLGVTITDLERKILYINEAEATLHGYTVEELLGKDVRILAPSKPRDKIRLEDLREMENWARESINVRKDGSRFPVYLMSDVVRNEHGEIIAIVTTCKDITERKRTEEELRGHREHLEELVRERTVELQQEIAERTRTEKALQEAKETAEAANRAKSEFLANMSHELRTPLNSIIGFSQLLTRHSNISSELHESLGIIHRSGEHLLMLINDILEMSRIEAGQISLDVQSFDLRRMMATIEEMMRIRAEGKGLTLLIDIEPEVPHFVSADERKLRQVLINLLSNAIKFTEKGTVTLEISNVGCELVDLEESGQSHMCNLKFTIQDTGIGIAPEEIGRLFKPFVQSRQHRKDNEGTGLGLAISRRFVKLMGGSLQVESDVGRGSVFSFDIHIETTDMNETDPAPLLSRRIVKIRSNPSSDDDERYRILVAEDIPENRIFLMQLLDSVGFDVRDAANGQEALERYENWQPHLIWMDMRMPIMDGYEATRRIREFERSTQLTTPRTPIIALTASAFENDKAQMLAAGCNDVVRKPVHETELFEMIQKYIGVRYIYEEDNASSSVKHQATITQGLTPNMLATLPQELLLGLEQAVAQLNMKEVDRSLETIRSRDADVAEKLAIWVKDFKYKEIWTMIQTVKEKSHV